MPKTSSFEANQAHNLPVALDPETGELEVLGNGRIAVLGKAGVERIVTLPQTDDQLDTLVADGMLSYSA